MASIVSCSTKPMSCEVFFEELLKDVGEFYYEIFFESFQILKFVGNKAVFSVSSSWCRAYLEIYFSQIIREKLVLLGQNLTDFEIFLRASSAAENSFAGSHFQKSFASEERGHDSLSVPSLCVHKFRLPLMNRESIDGVMS
ncbi:MAG: hypothetical protein ACRCYP_05745 [Alphaproteobacteria bacterium]